MSGSVSQEQFQGEAYNLRGVATELPFLGPAALRSLEDSDMPKPVTSWKIFAIYLEAGRSQDGFKEAMNKFGVNNHGGRVTNLFAAIDKKINSHGLKLYLPLSEAMSASSQMTDTKRGAFLVKAYDNDPVKYLSHWGKQSQEKLNGFLKVTQATTDALFALFLTVLKVDPTQDDGCGLFDKLLEEEVGITVKTNRATVIDQMQARLSVGFNYVAKSEEEGARKYGEWQRDPVSGRLTSRTVSKTDGVTGVEDAARKLKL